MFEESAKSLQILKFINHDAQQESDSLNNTVTILFRGNHFDLSYNETFVNTYAAHLNQYEYAVEAQKKEKLKERTRRLNEAKRKELIADAVGEKPRSLCMKINYQSNEDAASQSVEVNSNFNLFQHEKGDSMSIYNDTKNKEREIILDEQHQQQSRGLTAATPRNKASNHKDHNDNDFIIIISANTAPNKPT